MEILIAKKAGYCFGVKKAMEKAEECLKASRESPIYSLGALIHNDQALENLKNLGMRQAETVEEIPPGSVVILRSHGIGKSAYDNLQRQGMKIVDATCPFVRNIQNIVLEKASQGKEILVIGDEQHPEVQGICGWAGGRVLVGKTVDYFKNQPYVHSSSYAAVAQTTFNLEKYEEIKKYLQKEVRDIEFCDTICYATKERQDAARDLSQKVDAMVVLGGRCSSNTAKLAEICSEHCKTFCIEVAKDIDEAAMKSYNRIGITAGASTPDFVIQEVTDLLLTKIHVKELDLMSTEMEKLLMEEQDYQEVYKGSIVKGTVEIVKPDSYYIALSYKTDGVLPRSEVHSDEEINIGDELELEVVKIDKNTGELLLSKKRLDEYKIWDELPIGKEIRVRVVDRNEKGLIARYKNSVRGFIPLSHVENRFINESILENYDSKEMDVEIIDSDPKKRRLILSRKNVLLREQNILKQELMNKIVEGNVYKGVIKDIKNYGMFVDLGGLTGLVHISEVSWNRRDQIEKLYAINQEVDVQVLNFDRDKERLSLSVKSLVPNPWNIFIENHSAGDIIEGDVKNIKEYGVFVTLVSGIDGFVHISNLSTAFVKNPNEVVKVGDKVEAKILQIDNNSHKIELTLNLEDPKEEEAEETASEESAPALEAEVPTETAVEAVPGEAAEEIPAAQEAIEEVPVAEEAIEEVSVVEETKEEETPAE